MLVSRRSFSPMLIMHNSYNMYMSSVRFRDFACPRWGVRGESCIYEDRNRPAAAAGLSGSGNGHLKLICAGAFELFLCRAFGERRNFGAQCRLNVYGYGPSGRYYLLFANGRSIRAVQSSGPDKRATEIRAGRYTR